MSDSNNIQKELRKIQNEMSVPKVRNCGKFNGRSAEDILDAVKKVDSEISVTMTDDIVFIGDRYYVKSVATAHLGTETVSVTAFAREPDNMPGINSSQTTGATTSYARKYALGGLFMVDDSQDSDTVSAKDSQKANQNPQKPPIMQSKSNDVRICKVCKEKPNKGYPQCYDCKQKMDMKKAQEKVVA